MLPATVQIDREKYLLLCCAIAAGCGSSEPSRVATGGVPAPASSPAPTGSAAVVPAAAVTPDTGAPAAAAPPASRPVASGDGELDGIGEDLEKIAAARRDCNPAPAADYVAQLEMQHVEEIPRKQSPLQKSCDRIELPDRDKPGPTCEDPFFDCYAAIKMLRPESASAFIACLAPKSKTRAACGHGPGNCFAQTVNATRPAPTVTAVCARIAKRCRTVARQPLAEATCRKYLTAVDCDEVPTAGYCLANACSLRQCFDPIDEANAGSKSGGGGAKRSPKIDVGN
jgi:hypothetical protein